MMKTRRVSGAEYQAVRFLMLLTMWWIASKLYRNPIVGLRVVLKLLRQYKNMLGGGTLVRAFKTDGKYHWDMFNPSWPSPGFNTFFEAHFIEIQATSTRSLFLRRLFVAITKRCPLKCAHCSEAATLYNKDVLSKEELFIQLDSFVQRGVGQLVYSGGEPLSRFEDLVACIERYRSRCDQWVYSSGFGLTHEQALRLKQAGLNGVALSLDHHVDSEHNAFRGSNRSYYWVKAAVEHLNEVGIIVALNVCPSREYIDAKGPEKIIALAKEWGVQYVNFLEPRAVGNFEAQDVELYPSHKQTLKVLMESYNFNARFRSFPTVLFPAAYRHLLPCGGGRSYLLLDYDGTLYPCPFCKVKLSVFTEALEVCEAS